VSYTGFESEARTVFPYWITPDDAPLLRQAAASVENVLGYMPRLGRWDFSTDGVYTMGVAGIPTIGFGPGEERHTHTVDDQVNLADVHAAAQVYAQLALRMLR
jgi:acetylornithine deacetylase/succinyl-diaminopimelate desuccinylase-like protein